MENKELTPPPTLLAIRALPQIVFIWKFESIISFHFTHSSREARRVTLAGGGGEERRGPIYDASTFHHNKKLRRLSRQIIEIRLSPPGKKGKRKWSLLADSNDATCKRCAIQLYI